MRWLAGRCTGPLPLLFVTDVFTEHGYSGHIAWARTSSPVDVLFLHGFSDSASCWAPLISALDDRRGLIATDARGHGGSGLPEETFGRSTHVGDAVSVVEGQRADAVIVVGHSMGAATAAALAADRPDLVRAVVLEDPPPGDRPFRLKELMAGFLRERELDREARIARCRTDNPDWPEDEFKPWAVSKEQVNLRLFELGGEAPVPLPDLLARVRCPVLLIRGDSERGALVSSEFAARCANAAGGHFEDVHIEGAGHSVRRDRRQPYLDALTSFLSRHR